jgi:tetratricopeptide (TPR) repeat protein
MNKTRIMLLLALVFVVGFTVNAQTGCSTKTADEWTQTGIEHFLAFESGSYEFEEAIVAFDCAVELGVESAEIYAVLGLAHHLVGEYPEAVASYTRAIELDDQLAPAYLNRAESNLLMNNIDETVPADFLRWIELEATDTITSTLDEILQNGNLAVVEGTVYRLTFDGVAGQLFSVAALSDDLADPLIVLVAPDGTPLIGNDDSGVNLNSVIRDYALTVSGEYTLVVSQAGAAGIGEFELAILMDEELRSTNPDNPAIRDSFVIYNLYIGDTAEVFTTAGDRLNLRSGPGTRYEIIDRLERGEYVTLLDGVYKNEDDDGYAWWLIRTSDGTVGWTVERVVTEQTLQLALMPGEDAYVTSGEDLLNVRESASRSSPVAFQLEDGVQVTLLDEEPVVADNLRWWHIRDAAGREGWAVDRIGIERTLVPTREFPNGL